MAPATVKIPARFCGPPGWANGGYSCGSFAELAGLGSRASVTLRKPIPLETPLSGRREDGRVLVEADDAELIAEVAETEPLELEPPQRPDPSRAAEASLDSPFRTERHAYPGCFVCGPEHDGGLHVHAGGLDADGLVAAAPVRVPPDLLAEDGSLPTPLVWATLDCPSYVPGYWGPRVLLGRLAAEILAPVDGTEPLVAIGWGLGEDGRKLSSAAALVDADGRLLARSRALWIRVG